MPSCAGRSVIAVCLALGVAVASTCVPVMATGIVRVTEAMSSSGSGGTADWFELTNYGTTPVDIGGWRMDDDSFNFGVSVPLIPFSFTTESPAWTTIGPGESVVFVETSRPERDLSTFRTFWNLGPDGSNVYDPKLGSYSGSGVGLSSGGDAVTIYDVAGTEITRVRFGAATTGVSFFYTYDDDGVLATSANGVLSQPGILGAYQSTGIGNVGSPGFATVAADVGPPLYWTAAGSTLGGSGSWRSAGATWSTSPSPVVAVGWSDGRTAVFDGSAGTVSVAGDVAPLGLVFASGGHLLAAGGGAIDTASITVNPGLVATVAARLSGTIGIGVGGGGTLVLSGTANDYLGTTSVIEGTVRSGAAHVIPDASRVSVARFHTYDFAGHADTVGGLLGLGTIDGIGGLTVNVATDADAVFNGSLRGSGSLVIDSAGTGWQRLDTTAQTLNQDFAVKDYTGRTVIRRGALAVDRTAIPIATSGVEIESGGHLVLSSNSFEYTFGGSPAVPVELRGGSIGQEAGEDVALLNAVSVLADSTITITNTINPDPTDPTTEWVRLAGPLSGDAGRRLVIAASATEPGADLGRVEFTAPGPNPFAGTLAAQVNVNARFTGEYAAATVEMGGGRLDGTGIVGSVRGLGTIAPGVPDFGPGFGILAMADIDPAGFDYRFEFSNANADPVWFSPTLSENDLLRLTATDAFAGGVLTGGNAVSLLLDVDSITAGDFFRGGFFTTADRTAAIIGASYQAYVRGDGLGTDLTVSDVGYYSLASWSTLTGTTLRHTVEMVPVTAEFDPFVPTAGFVMQTTFTEGPPVVRIDVGTGRFTLPPSPQSPEPELRAQLIAGRDGGSWDGASGIMSSDAPIYLGTSGFAVGYRVFNDNSALVSWASLGDADLDGAVTTADVNAILTSGLLNTGIAGATWQQGDFDYDGLLTTADINALLTTGRLNTGSYLPNQTAALQGPGASGSAVPEPSALWLAAAAGLAVLAARGARRARRRPTPTRSCSRRRPRPRC